MGHSNLKISLEELKKLKTSNALPVLALDPSFNGSAGNILPYKSGSFIAATPFGIALIYPDQKKAIVFNDVPSGVVSDEYDSVIFPLNDDFNNGSTGVEMTYDSILTLPIIAPSYMRYRIEVLLAQANGKDVIALNWAYDYTTNPSVVNINKSYDAVNRNLTVGFDITLSPLLMADVDLLNFLKTISDPYTIYTFKTYRPSIFIPRSDIRNEGALSAANVKGEVYSTDGLVGYSSLNPSLTALDQLIDTQTTFNGVSAAVSSQIEYATKAIEYNNATPARVVLQASNSVPSFAVKVPEIKSNPAAVTVTDYSRNIIQLYIVK
jgi:hypothetical protein